IHGASAMLMMIYFGYLLATHVSVGLRSKRNRVLGLTLVYAIGFMIVTAYGLYYLGSEGVRQVVSWAHTAVGFSLPLVLGLHVAMGHRSNSANTKPLALPSARSTS